MNKLSTKDRQRVSDVLAECARETKDIDNPAELSDRAYSILSNKLGDNPGLFKAACQVYNSCKSIHKLSEADDNTRGNSFSILDVQELSSRLAKENDKSIRKAASAPAVFSTVPVARRSTEKAIRKVASAVDEAEDLIIKVKLPDNFDYKNHMREAVVGMEDLLTKSASMVTTAEREYHAALERFVTHFATVAKDIRKEAAARLQANFGELADNLIDTFNRLRPLQKLASAEYSDKYRGTPSIPEAPLYKVAMEAMIAADALEKAEEQNNTIVETVADAATDLSRKYMNVTKEAAAGMSIAATGMAAGGGSGLVSKLFGEGGNDDEAIRRKIYTTDLSNALLAHGTKRAFMSAVMNPSIAKYPLHKIVAAFNKAIANLPPNSRLVSPTANQKLVEGLMIENLATGSTPSKADVELYSNLATSLGKLKTAQGIYEGNNPDVE